MIEIVFSESAEGSLKLASGNGKYMGGAMGIIFEESDGKKPGRRRIKKLIREAEEAEKRNWEEAVPIESCCQGIMCFPLALSIGGINEDEIGEEREKVLKRQKKIYPYISDLPEKNIISEARERLTELISRAKNGETVRIWTSDMPDEACGLYWIIERLSKLGLEELNVVCVNLPPYQVRIDGNVVIYNSWGEVPPHQWGKLAELGKKLPVNYMRSLVFQWKLLKEENSNLRAVLNGRLQSVPENLYDTFILREIKAQDTEFLEAKVIGNVLGKYFLGVGDSLIAFRIEKFIEAGMLKAVTEPDPEDALYHRILRKTSSDLRQ